MLVDVKKRSAIQTGGVERLHRILLEEWAYIRPWASPAERTAGYAGFVHDLRHDDALVLIAAGGSVKAVQEALGHKDHRATFDTCSHLSPADNDHSRKAMEKLQETNHTKREESR